MKQSKMQIIDIEDKEIALQTLVEGSNREDLVQCIHLISLYVSIYKKHFGELPVEYYEDLFQADGIDDSSTELFESGLNEAIAMLDMIIKTSPRSLPYKFGNLTIN